jgi:hypothetical protein
MSTNFAKEFKLYENLNKDAKRRSRKNLSEARSAAEIQAEIEKLQRELADAKVAEKRTSYDGKMPKTVWVWDMYIDPKDKGTWVSLDNDTVFETEEEALDAGWLHLNELDDEGELFDDDDEDVYIEPDDYTVEAYEIPISSVSDEVLEWSNLEHLIDNPQGTVECGECGQTFKTAKSAKICKCPHCGIELEIDW